MSKNKGKIINIDSDAYIVRSEWKENFQKVIDKYGVNYILKELNCDKLVKTNDNLFLVVEKIEEAQILTET